MTFSLVEILLSFNKTFSSQKMRLKFKKTDYSKKYDIIDRLQIRGE